MTIQTREKPPVVVYPDVEHLMKGDMLKVRDLMVDWTIALAETHDIAIVRIMIQSRVWTEDDSEDEDVVFTIDVDAHDDARALSYWEAVSEVMTEETVPEGLRGMLDNTWIQVYW